MQNEAIKIGTRVEGGKVGTEDHDFGRVLDIEGNEALVAWEGGACKIWTAISDLTIA